MYVALHLPPIITSLGVTLIYEGVSWYTFWGNGNNVPWFTAERPVIFISLANPYHLIDVPMIKTYINGYSNSEYVIDAVVEKIMGRSRFEGKTPVDPFCGKEYLKW